MKEPAKVWTAEDLDAFLARVRMLLEPRLEKPGHLRAKTWRAVTTGPDGVRRKGKTTIRIESWNESEFKHSVLTPEEASTVATARIAASPEVESLHEIVDRLAGTRP